MGKSEQTCPYLSLIPLSKSPCPRANDPPPSPTHHVLTTVCEVNRTMTVRKSPHCHSSLINTRTMTLSIHSFLKRFKAVSMTTQQFPYIRPSLRRDSHYSRLFRPRPPCLSVKRCLRPSAVLETIDHTATIHSTSLLRPIEKTDRKSMFLSNIDKVLNFKVGTVLFFSRNPDFSMEEIVEKLENAFSKLLVHYDFLAGRLKWNDDESRLEIDCNSAGAGFVVASCDKSFEEMGGIWCPNEANKQLALRKWNASPEDQPLCVMQVTSFRGGGFALGFSLNHVTSDGISSKIILENLASLLADNDLALSPYNNRRLLTARSPPCVTFPHAELFNFESLEASKSNKLLLRATFQKLNSQYFYLSHKDIMNLKQKARKGSGESLVDATAFNVVAAHIWQCVANAKDHENNPDQPSTILYAVNIRSRIRPRLPSLYAGNAILSAYSTTTCGEIRTRPFSHLVQLVSQGDKRLTDEYIRSTIDWLEICKGFPYGDALISSWWKLGFNEIEFPWGRPTWTCPVVPNHGNNAITLMPVVEDKRFKGLQVLVSLPYNEMEKFQGLFRELL